MLEKRLVQIEPAELFKTVYNQNINLVMLDVRPNRITTSITSKALSTSLR